MVEELCMTYDIGNRHTKLETDTDTLKPSPKDTLRETQRPISHPLKHCVSLREVPGSKGRTAPVS